MDARGRDGCAELRRLERPGEDQCAAAGEHALCELAYEQKLTITDLPGVLPELSAAAREKVAELGPLVSRDLARLSSGLAVDDRSVHIETLERFARGEVTHDAVLERVDARDAHDR